MNLNPLEASLDWRPNGHTAPEVEPGLSGSQHWWSTSTYATCFPMLHVPAYFPTITSNFQLTLWNAWPSSDIIHFLLFISFQHYLSICSFLSRSFFISRWVKNSQHIAFYLQWDMTCRDKLGCSFWDINNITQEAFVSTVSQPLMIATNLISIYQMGI